LAQGIIQGPSSPPRARQPVVMAPETRAVVLAQVLALGFPEARVLEALDSVSSGAGADEVIDWLLDHGEEDKGGAVQFKRCLHLDDPSVCLVAVESLAFEADSICGKCGECRENWLCLACGKTHCGRYAQRHGLEHFGEAGHSAALSLRDLSIWCYICKSYVEHPRLQPLRTRIEFQKFGSPEDADLPRQPQALVTLDIAGIATFAAERKVRNIIVMCGAGISTSAGIPDFRSPGTGLYANLARFNLPQAESIFTLKYFHQHPEPFYELCKELWPGKHCPTVCHYFLLLLHRKGILRRCYTQNIDSLETQAGLPPEALVAVHGNFDKAHRCPSAGASGWSSEVFSAEADADVEVSAAEMRAAVEAGEVGWRALADKYGGLCKPRIVFFGEDLPPRVHDNWASDFAACDLLLVMGTSLVVEPFAGFVAAVGAEVPRLLINRDAVGLEGAHGLEGGFRFHQEASNYRDVFFQGDCDAGCRAMARLLGWEADLEALLAAGGAAEVAVAPWAAAGAEGELGC